jgi:hypothetical protein
MDIHELQITPQGTALVTCYPDTVDADLTPVGGHKRGRVLESIFQEIDIRSGRLLMEWRSLDHIPVSETYAKPVPSAPFDYLHLNSIEVAPDGNLIVSGRHTFALYKLDRRTGAIMWRLGGKRTDFDLEPAARFSWQHDARLVDGRTISLFDDGTNGTIKTEKHARGLVLDVDTSARKVRLKQEFRHSPDLVVPAMGSMQVLAAGHALVGWGTQPYVSEFAADGSLVWDVHMAVKQQTYRGFRATWHGRPKDEPALAAGRSTSGGAKRLYASWNGATEVAGWAVKAGSSSHALKRVGVVKRSGFETAISVGRARGHASVTALDASGRRLGESRAIRF